jgi:hypothetical protein
MSNDPRAPFYLYSGPQPRQIIRAAIALSVIGFVATLWVAYDAWATKVVLRLYLTIGIWAVVPPVWFWIEYFFIYRRYGQPGTLELFKYGQDVAKAIWAGVLAALVGLAASDLTKPGNGAAPVPVPTRIGAPR